MMTEWRESFADDAVGTTQVAEDAPWPPPERPVIEDAASPVTPRRSALELVFVVGLAGVFLANAVVAWVEPRSFSQLVEDSRVGSWLGLGEAGWVMPLIGINDLLVGIVLLAALWSRRAQPFVLAWAGVWLLAVTVLKLTALP